MPTYIQIRNNSVRLKQEIPEGQIVDPTFIDVTNWTVQPSVGWKYTGDPLDESNYYDPAERIITCEISYTGGDGRTPPGINIDGSNPLTVNLTFKQNETLVPVEGSWRISIVNNANVVKDVFVLNVNTGASTFTYTPYQGMMPGIYSFDLSSLEQISIDNVMYNIVITGGTTFKLYREL